tara:strand:- start:372 stop:752 length:381 start_codon:yes stop_codon:yes gene_type:complete
MEKRALPKFELITKDEAKSKSRFCGRSGQILAMYTLFIEQLKDGKAGRLKASEGETIQAVRRRLGKAAKMAGKELTIRRVHDEIYFWLGSEDGASQLKHKLRKRVAKSPAKLAPVFSNNIVTLHDR